MFLAKLAVFAELQSVRIIFLVLIGLIVALFAFSTGQCNSVAHFLHLSYPKNHMNCHYMTILRNIANTI